jgi:putative toxin-antitoxin system antitoxin component (TIGR02293 family)
LASGTIIMAAVRRPAPRHSLRPPGFGETGQAAFAAGAVLETLAVDGPLAPTARARPNALAELAQHGFSEDEVFQLVVPRRTLARRRARNELLTVEETDKALRLMRIALQAERVFGEPDKAYRWLRKPKRGLNGETPVAYLATEAGARAIETWLIRIEHGMAA